MALYKKALVVCHQETIGNDDRMMCWPWEDTGSIQGNHPVQWLSTLWHGAWRMKMKNQSSLLSNKRCAICQIFWVWLIHFFFREKNSGVEERPSYYLDTLDTNLYICLQGYACSFQYCKHFNNFKVTGNILKFLQRYEQCNTIIF